MPEGRCPLEALMRILSCLSCVCWPLAARATLGAESSPASVPHSSIFPWFCSPPPSLPFPLFSSQDLSLDLGPAQIWNDSSQDPYLCKDSHSSQLHSEVHGGHTFFSGCEHNSTLYRASLTSMYNFKHILSLYLCLDKNCIKKYPRNKFLKIIWLPSSLFHF